MSLWFLINLFSSVLQSFVTYAPIKYMFCPLRLKFRPGLKKNRKFDSLGGQFIQDQGQENVWKTNAVNNHYKKNTVELITHTTHIHIQHTTGDI